MTTIETLKNDYKTVKEIEKELIKKIRDLDFTLKLYQQWLKWTDEEIKRQEKEQKTEEKE